MLLRSAKLWVDLTKAATEHDQGRAEAIHREITQCRQWVEEIGGYDDRIGMSTTGFTHGLGG